MTPEHRKPIFETKSVNPENLEPDVQAQLFLEAMDRLQQIASSVAGKNEVVKQIKQDIPVNVFIIGDLHFGHVASAHQEILSLRERILAKPNNAVIFVGDEIEGFTTKYPTTSSSQTHASGQEQIDMIKTLLFRPLAEQGRVLAIVSEYFGHPGWLNDGSTISPWKMMADIACLEEYEKYKIQVLSNGGLVHLDFPNHHRQSIRIHHNPPGNSRIDPLHGLRLEALNESVETRPNGYGSGHIHRSGIAKEQYSGSDVPVFMISSGTTKGSNPDKPRDLFGVRLGLTMADPIGQGVIVIPRHRGEKFDRNYPYISFKHGETAHTALEILDHTEKNKLTAELLEQIRAKDQPEVELLNHDSKVIRANSPYNEKEREIREEKAKTKAKGKDKEGNSNGNGDYGRPNRYPDVKLAPVYDALTYNVGTDLPVALHLVSNARLGSTVEGLAALRDYQDLVAKDPHSLIVYLRNMIDKEIASDNNRISVLNKMIRLMNRNKPQVIALLLDANLRSNDWDRNLDDNCPPPGSYISQETDTPLIHHLSLIKIAVGAKGTKLAQKPMYIGAFADRLEKHGSYSKPTFGLLQLYNNALPSKPGYVAGGHMPNSGTMMFHHGGNSETRYPALIAPGWWSNYVDTIGSGNVKLGALPGQAIIFMPGTNKSDYMVFPTANADETKYMHDSLLLLKGLNLLGLDPQSFISR